MEEVGITYLKDKPCTQMSGGELQMVLIPRALAAQPELPVLDEPESNPDFKNQLIILETIRRLAKEKNISSIVNTHYPAHALQISHKALILNKEEKSRYGPTQEIICEEHMREAFSVNVSVQQFSVNGKSYQTVVHLSIAK